MVYQHYQRLLAISSCILSILAAESCGKKFSSQVVNERHSRIDVAQAITADSKPVIVESVVERAQAIGLTDKEAEAFFAEKCVSCHGIGKDYHSFWPMPASVNKAILATDPFKEDVYQAIYNMSRAFRPSGQPAPMPPGKRSKLDMEIGSKLIAWVRKELPELAFSADLKYGNSDSPITGINFNFTCSRPLSIREYVRKFSNDAFGREPIKAELEAYGNPDQPVSEKVKDLIAAKIMKPSSTEKQEFMLHGLRSFADKFSGSSEIRIANAEGIAEENIGDLKQEFYQKLLADVETKSFREILLSNTVMITENTAILYGAPNPECAVPDIGAWGPCKMLGQRETYWGTVGFLASKPTSFLETNNNYGRAALMQFGINGDVFLAATNGPKGATVEPLPKCLKTKDLRGDEQPDHSVAPYGSAKIPQSGNICQSCHIARNLAVGSMVFRPFTSAGLVFKKEMIATDDPVYGAKVTIATGPTKVLQDGPTGDRLNFDPAFLKSLLEFGSGGEAPCVPKGGAKGADLPINGLKDLATYLLGEGDKKIVEGLSRHIPRAISNSSVTTGEISNAIQTSFVASGGKLIPAIAAYFRSETYSCAIDAATLGVPSK